MASAAYPVVFTPVEMHDSLYADGGILNNFPIEPLLHHCDKIIGVYVTPIKEVQKKDFRTSLSVLERAYSLSIEGSSLSNLSKCDILIKPNNIEKFWTFGMYHFDDVFKVGYESAMEKLQTVQR